MSKLIVGLSASLLASGLLLLTVQLLLKLTNKLSSSKIEICY